MKHSNFNRVPLLYFFPPLAAGSTANCTQSWHRITTLICYSYVLKKFYINTKIQLAAFGSKVV